MLQVRQSARRFLLVAGICLLAIASGAGIFESASAARAQAPKGRATSMPLALGPAPATGAFGLDLLRSRPRGNLVLSPDSIAAALAMAGTGATGRTATQIAGTLHLREPGAFDAVGDLQRAIVNHQASAGLGHPKAPKLELANGLFLQRGFPLRPTFVSGLQRHFGVVPEAVDFWGDLSGSLKAVNAWVSDRTEGIIPQLLDSLPEETRLVLANAIYLNASWRYPFDPAFTARGPFHGEPGSTTVEFMHETEPLRYGSGPGYKAVDLPYRASTLSLLVILPTGSVAALQRHLDARALDRITDGLSRRRAKLSLPRFHLTTQVDMKNTLESLGMTAAFSESAEFPRITSAEELKIALVEHAADFSVDEAGTVAAAATVVGFVPRSRSPRHAVEFNANRPFLFFLRDDRTGAVLFAGRLTNPASAGA